LFQDVQTFPTAQQTLDLAPQALVTASGRPVVVSGILLYRLKDVETILVNTYEPDEITADVGRSAIADVVTGHELTELVAMQRSGELARLLSARCKSKLRRFGILVSRCSLNELAPCSVVRLVGPGAAVLPGTEDNDDV
jgi:regulator of protease activity HflC (stomatin/prohibitin superfamily)